MSEEKVSGAEWFATKELAERYRDKITYQITLLAEFLMDNQLILNRAIRTQHIRSLESATKDFRELIDGIDDEVLR